MSYIRTKDGVYEVVDTYEVKYVIGYNEDGFEISIYKDQVIKQSEKLEDLIDNAIYIIDGFFKSVEERKITWYGAIYTEKGIITVAKTNENGEWELI